MTDICLNGPFKALGSARLRTQTRDRLSADRTASRTLSLTDCSVHLTLGLLIQSVLTGDTPTEPGLGVRLVLAVSVTVGNKQ